MFAVDAFSEISFAGTPKAFSSSSVTATSASTSITSFTSWSNRLTPSAVTGTGSVTSPVDFVAVQQSGRIGTGNVGNVAPKISPTATAATGTGAVSSITFSYTANLTGRSATVTAGTLVPTRLSSISSVAANGSVGSFNRVFYWTQVNDNQTPNWTPVVTQ